MNRPELCLGTPHCEYDLEIIRRLDILWLHAIDVANRRGDTDLASTLIAERRALGLVAGIPPARRQQT